MGQYKSRLVAGLLAATMVLSPVVSMASKSETAEDNKSTTQEKLTVQRISGKNRTQTSLRVAQKLGISSKAFYASGISFPDALSVGTIAAKQKAPIILGENSEEIIREMKKLGINEVVIVGGKGSVSEEEEKAIKDNIDAEAKRLSGKDRYETSKAILNEYKITNVGVVGGEAYADALTANPHLAQKDNGVYLMDSSSKLADGFEASVTIGGENSVKELFGEKRLSGKNRYATAAAIANEFEDFDTVVIADGRNFADALSAAPLAADLGAPIVLTNGKEVPEEVKEIIAKAKKAIIVGGESSVPKEVISTINGKLVPSGLDPVEDAKIEEENHGDAWEDAAKDNLEEEAKKEAEKEAEKVVEEAKKEAEEIKNAEKEHANAWEDAAATENLRFKVKSIKDGNKQKLATQEEVSNYFNEQITNGLTLDVKVKDGKIDIGNTKMSKELWNKLKNVEGANKAIAYRITVINGEETSKIEFKADGTAVLTDGSKGAISSGYVEVEK